MTPTKDPGPPSPCSGVFRATCEVCNEPTHPEPASGPARKCADGHRVYGGKGRCRRCYRSDYLAGRLPATTPVPHARRQAAEPEPPKPAPEPEPLPTAWEPVPVELRSTTPAPCDRCGRIERLTFGPGEALCPDCDLAQLLDRADAADQHEHDVVLARGGPS